MHPDQDRRFELQMGIKWSVTYSKGSPAKPHLPVLPLHCDFPAPRLHVPSWHRNGLCEARKPRRGMLPRACSLWRAWGRGGQRTSTLALVAGSARKIPLDFIH